MEAKSCWRIKCDKGLVLGRRMGFVTSKNVVGSGVALEKVEAEMNLLAMASVLSSPGMSTDLKRDFASYRFAEVKMGWWRKQKRESRRR